MKEQGLAIIKKTNRWMVLTFILAVITSSSITFVILNYQLDPYTSYDPDLSERYNIQTIVRVEYLNGTISFYDVPEEIDKYVLYNNHTERVIRQDYHFYTTHLNLSYTSFTDIALVIMIPPDAFDKFRIIEVHWRIEDKEGTISKINNDFKFPTQLNNVLIGEIDIINVMYRDVPPNVIDVGISFFNRD